MRILQVVPYFEWSSGGPVKVVHDLTKELIARGHEVTIYTTNVGNNGYLKENDKIDVENAEVKYFRCVNNYLAKNFKLHFSTEMKNAIKNNISNFDIVHLHEARGIPNIYIHKYAVENGIPYIIQGHGSFPKILGRQTIIRTFSKFFFDRMWGEKLIKDAAKLIALNKNEVKFFDEFGATGDNVKLIPNAINLSEYDRLPPKGNFKLKYDINEHDSIILYLGRIDNTKGIDLLIDAFNELSEKIDNIKLVIAGPDYGVLSKIERQIKRMDLENKILITGPLYGINKFEAYIDADVFVTPSFYGFPITFLESCATGTPIVTTDKNDLLEWIDGEVGYVAEYDKYHLSNAIYAVLTNLESFDESCKKVADNYSWKKITNSFENVYRDAVGA